MADSEPKARRSRRAQYSRFRSFLIAQEKHRGRQERIYYEEINMAQVLNMRRYETGPSYKCDI